MTSWVRFSAVAAVFAATAGIVFPATAQDAAAGAPKWATCTFEASGGVGTSIALVIIEPFQVSSNRSDGFSIGSDYDRLVGVASVVPGYHLFVSFTDKCSVYPDEASARTRLARVSGWSGYSIMKTVAWQPPGEVTGLGSSGQSKSTVTSSSGSKGSYKGTGDVVKAPSVVDPAWDEKVREQLRKDAEGRAKAVAATAREDARMKAQADKFFAEMKKRGSAQ
jgi:hypothetical protein